MKNLMLILSFILLASSCASMTHLKLITTEKNKEFLLDGEVAMTSKKDNSKVTIRFNNFPRNSEVIDGQQTYLWLSIKNLSKNEFTFRPSKHIQVLRVSDKESAHIHKYKDLLEKKIKDHKRHAHGLFLGWMKLPQSHLNLIKLSLKNLIKPSTLTSNSMLSGLVSFQLPELPDDKIHTHFIKIKAGEDTHLFKYTQAKK